MRRLVFAAVLACCLLLNATGMVSTAGAESYSFSFGGFANRVQATNADSEELQHVSEAITDYFFEELSDCPKMLLYDTTLQASQGRIDEMMIQMDLGQMPVEYREVNSEYVICGWLNNLGVMYSSTKIALFSQRSHKVMVDVAVNIFEAKSGKKVFTATGRGEADSRDLKVGIGGLRLMRFGDKEFSYECYTKALRLAVKQAADKIEKAI